jgi:hypothetical protein
MAERNQQSTTPREGLWHYIPLDEFTKPRASTRETVRKGFSGMLDRFRQSDSNGPDATTFIQEKLKRLPQSLRDQVAPDPDWTKPAAALTDAMRDWLTAKTPASRHQIVVGAPCSGRVEVLLNWATIQSLTVLQPPSPEEILGDDPSWLDRLPEQFITPVVIPCLECYFLRHTHGLNLLRQFLDWLMKQSCHCLIGCSSWAWAYLSKALAIDALFTPPWTLGALDGKRLQQWFNALAKRQFGRTIVFRQADNGRFVIPPPQPSQPSEKEKATSQGNHKNRRSEEELSTFLMDVAARSRGNPGVAWALWQHSLRMAPANEQKQDEYQTDAYDLTIWVAPWHQLKLPTLGVQPPRSELFILHVLLLHNSLTTQHIIQLLPLTAFEVMRVLDQMANAGLLENFKDKWHIAPLGYPAVREALEQEGFLIDAL